jgi:hypothetical protein
MWDCRSTGLTRSPFQGIGDLTEWIGTVNGLSHEREVEPNLGEVETEVIAQIHRADT